MDDKKKLAALEALFEITPHSLKKATRIINVQSRVLNALLVFSVLQTIALVAAVSYLVFFK